MTKPEMETKIKQLETWLQANPNHYEFGKILNDKNHLQNQLNRKQYDS